MSEQEAIKILKCSKNKFTVLESEINRNAAIDIAIKSLEKQVAKKPVYSRLYATTPNMNCSVCGKTLLTDYPKFCSDCGQKIDWSDEE